MPDKEPLNEISVIKPSNYNYFIEYDEDYFVGYNSLYQSILRIPKGAYPIIEKFFHTATEGIDCSQLPSQWLTTLRDCHFIIDKDIDELSLIKFLYFRNLYANDRLNLIVLPTLWCNLACPYCNEIKKPIFMNREVEDILLKWIQNNFRYKRKIDVAWFGGEPLLAKKIIIRLTNNIRNFCNNINATYSASLTTNGYYLDRRFIDLIDDLSIKRVQITLDGDQSDHDALRRRRNGAGSFERIFNNIIAFCESSTKCDLSLRVNCCDDNYDGIKQLLKLFPQSVIARAQIYFRWVYPDEANGYHEFSCQARGKEPFSGLAKLYSAAQALGWRTSNPSLESRSAYCEVDYLDHYAIGPDGNVFLCSHTFKESEAVGSLQNGYQPTGLSALSKYVRWYSVTPFEDAECINCQLLPICKGGCRRSRVTGQKKCIEEKDNIDYFIKNVVGESLLQNKSKI